MYLKSIELSGFKSFGKKTELLFTSPIAGIVGPNGSGKSNVAEAFRFVLGEQSMKSLRSKKGEDLIWGGSPGLVRANRAGVKAVFDNSSRFLDIDFPEVTIERVVYRDGQNEYLLNGSPVRLKDVVRLLAGANIGGSGYQIISQGEADRILSASPKERREMVEDALGLKLYQHKKAESERKLEETAVNRDKTKSLRRELAPHLHFLRQQVEKIEKAREMKEELSARLSEYLAREHAYITQGSAYLKEEEKALVAELKERAVRLAEARRRLAGEGARAPQRGVSEGDTAEEARRTAARARREELARELGRAEAALEFAVPEKKRERGVSGEAVRAFTERLAAIFAEGERAESLEALRSVLLSAKREVEQFAVVFSTPHEGASPESEAARERVAEVSERLRKAVEEEARAEEELRAARTRESEERESLHAAERTLLVEEGAERECRAKLDALRAKLDEYALLRRAFEDEVRECIALVGAGVHSWEKAEVPEGALAEPRDEQEKRRRAFERLKIKIEEAGASRGDEVIREFKQTKERDEFLARELADLESSEEKLKDIIVELEKTIDSRFSEGIVKINEALTSFFSKLFGGGEALLVIEKPERRVRGDAEDEDAFTDTAEEVYAGLSIAVSLPRKKVRGLEVLSGGERALTSIALIFSMSQVNPPPFLILDETDAALDEANSRRYAEMIRELGAKSQLIVITHNRATMAAAGELYGVTMDTAGVSKVLSVKLQEAEKVAK